MEGWIMVQAVASQAPVTPQPSLRPLSDRPASIRPLKNPPSALAPQATPALRSDSFTGHQGPSAKTQLAGVWANVVVGDSDRSYRLKVPKDVPAGFTLDESKLDAADRHELQKMPQLRDMFTKLQYLESTDPQAKAAFSDLLTSLRNGDIMLRTYGTSKEGGRMMRATGVKDPSGPGVLNSIAIATTGGAYSHVAMVEKGNDQARPHVIESIFEGGVVDSGLYTFLYAMVDPGMGDRAAVTLFRPTENSREAAAAVDFAKQQVGTKYNFSMQPNRSRVEAQQNGWYCSQLVYASFDQNPAIGRQVFGIKQDGDDANRARLTHALVSGLQGNKALNNFFTDVHGKKMSQKAPGALLDIGTAMLQAGPRKVLRDGLHSALVAGDVAAGAVLHRKSSPTMTTVGGREVPRWVTPGDMAPNDGRKVMTLVFDHQP
jgi:uncharacterized protein YycO